MKPEDYIKRNEGIQYKPYVCPAGKLTIGWGRNLTSNGISRDEAEYLFQNDYRRAVQIALDLVPDLYDRDEVRATVIVDMAFNLGKLRLQGFKKMLQSFRDGNYERAAREIEDSRYYYQVGDRGKRNVEMMRTGEWKLP